jgi:hypothetical protein
MPIKALKASPYIEGFVERLDSRSFEKVRPNEITEEFIYEKVSRFLDEMILWGKKCWSRKN